MSARTSQVTRRRKWAVTVHIVPEETGHLQRQLTDCHRIYWAVMGMLRPDEALLYLYFKDTTTSTAAAKSLRLQAAFRPWPRHATFESTRDMLRRIAMPNTFFEKRFITPYPLRGKRAGERSEAGSALRRLPLPHSLTVCASSQDPWSSRSRRHLPSLLPRRRHRLSLLPRRRLQPSLLLPRRRLQPSFLPRSQARLLSSLLPRR